MPGAPSTTTGLASTRSAYLSASAPELWARVRAAPSAGSRSSVAAYRAPSDAAAASVLRTSSTSASWRMPRNSGTSTTSTSTKSTTEAPRRSRDRRTGTALVLHRVERPLEHLLELVVGKSPDRHHETGGHHRDQHPAGYVAALVPYVPLGQPQLQPDEERQQLLHGLSPFVAPRVQGGNELTGS